MQPCGRCGGNNVEAHHVRSEHFGGIRCEATRGMVHDSGTPFSRAASGATVLCGMRVTETLVYCVWRCCFTTGLRQWQAVTVLPAGYGYLAGMTQEAAGAGENTRKFRGDAVSTRKRLMAKKATPSIMQRKRENFMARLRCPKQAAASGKEPLQAVACYFRQTDRTSLTTTGYTVHNGSWFGVKG